MNNKVAFIFCIEKGQLEKETISSIRSLRHFGGRLSSSSVYCICPRPKRAICDKSRSILNDLNVTYIEENLNTEYQSYPLANKPLVCEYVEAIDQASDYLIFLDSDTLVINPLDTIINEYVDIQLSPVLVKNLGLSSQNDSNYSYWKKIINLFKLNELQKTRTLITNEEIFGYWNSGVIVVKNHKDIFKKWSETFKTLYEASLLPDERFYHTEQLSLSLLIHKNEFNFSELPNKYNYHISNQEDLHSLNKIFDYKEIHILHYHKLLQFSSFRFPFPKLKNLNFIEQWIKNEFKSQGLYPLGTGKRVKHAIGNFYYKHLK